MTVMLVHPHSKVEYLTLLYFGSFKNNYSSGKALGMKGSSVSGSFPLLLLRTQH